MKDLKDLSDLPCKSYDTHPCLSEKTDHIISNASRALKHCQDWVFLRKSGQTSKPSQIREKYCPDVVAKDLGVYTRPVIRFHDQIASETNTLLSELLLTGRGVVRSHNIKQM
jgi:hypothetical protein